jgi:steroid delta-isomerase-like uncharacterized protein
MSTDDNTASIHGFFELVNTRSLAGFESAIAPQLLDEEQAFYSDVFRIFPDFHLTIEDAIAQADQVAIRFRVHGTHQGAWRGLGATGKQISWTGMQWFRLADGKIVEHSIAADQLNVMEQLAAPA